MMKTPVLLVLLLLLAITACNLPVPLAGNPTITPGPSPTASSTPLPSATPTAEPTPTPLPAVRIESADEALFYGDYARARNEYQTAFNESFEGDIRAAALLGMARVDFLEQEYASTLALLRILTTDYPDNRSLPSAFFLIGETYVALGRYQEASDAYNSYLTLRPGIIDSFVQEKRGDAMLQIGRYSDAVVFYNAAMNAPHLGDNLSLEIKIANTYSSAGDLNAALSLYDSIASRAPNDSMKAQMNLLAGRAYLQLGQPDKAYERFLHSVENYPSAFDSYSGLVALVDANIPVSEFDRGLVDYYAGQYNLALAAFNRYIKDNPSHDGTVLHFQALTQRALANHQDAINNWTVLINQYPNNGYWTDAWREKAFTQWAYLSQHDAAAQTLLDFVNLYSAHVQAPSNLFEAARILERNNRLTDAALTWERITEEYPTSNLVTSALFLAGIARFRSGDFRGAEVNFQRNFILADNPVDQARNLFWTGKAQKSLNMASEAAETWQRTLTYDPTGYYSERARDMLLNREPFADPSVYNIDYDLVVERSEAAAWVRLSFNLPAETNLSNPGPLAADPRFWRGTEFWDLGLYDQARLEFEDLRKSVSLDPANSFRLANYLLDLGLYRTAIFAAREVLNLAGLDDAGTLTAPSYFNHVRFGTYYSDIIIPTALTNEMHPLFLYSVIRQESLFEGFVRSSAGARGLMQIIPSTGDSIARNLNWPPDYTSEDLYRPLVSVILGANYLKNNINNLNSAYAGLAAYNAGPGNSAIWNNLAGGDPDLFLEIIRFPETQRYIRGIYEVHQIYRLLYSPSP